MYIYSRWNVAGRSIEFSAKMALFWLFCLLTTHTECCSVYWLHIRHAQLPTYKLSLATRLHGQWLIEDDLNKRSAKHTNKPTLVARGADRQLGSSCVLDPLATNVDLWIPIIHSNWSFGYRSELARVSTTFARQRPGLARRRQRPSAGAHAAAATEDDGPAPSARLRGPRRSPRVTALETRQDLAHEWCTRRVNITHRTFDASLQTTHSDTGLCGAKRLYWFLT